MKLLNTFILVSVIVLSGCCTKPEPTVYVEYQDVYIPIKYKIDRPTRPKFNSSKQSIPEYINEVLNHSRTLEVLIDEHNK